MGQSKYSWIVVYSDGVTVTLVCTWEELFSVSELNSLSEPVAVIRGDLA